MAVTTKQDTVEANSDRPSQPTERELKQKSRRQVKLKATALGKGGAEFLGILEHIAGKQDPNVRNLWVELFQTCVEDPGEWYNRKFYYDNENKGNSHGSVASVINRQGETSDTDPARNTLWCQKLRELSKLYGGEFQAEYTRDAVKSDAPHQGKFMNIVFVRFVRTPRKPRVQDAMAVHSSRRD